jgi:hypothetical protein
MQLEARSMSASSQLRSMFPSPELRANLTVVAGEAIFASVEAAVVTAAAIAVVKDLPRQRFLRAGVNCGRNQHDWVRWCEIS